MGLNSQRAVENRDKWRQLPTTLAVEKKMKVKGRFEFRMSQKAGSISEKPKNPGSRLIERGVRVHVKDTTTAVKHNPGTTL